MFVLFIQRARSNNVVTDPLSLSSFLYIGQEQRSANGLHFKCNAALDVKIEGLDATEPFLFIALRRRVIIIV